MWPIAALCGSGPVNVVHWDLVGIHFSVLAFLISIVLDIS